jgi:hypothetical protein
MRIDGISLIEGSQITNLVIATAAEFPTLPNIGEAFYATGAGTPAVGFYVYDGTVWQAHPTKTYIDGLVNGSVTIGTTTISPGGSSATLAGLTSVTSTTFVGALTGNASTATSAAALTTARAIAATGDATWSASFNGSADVSTALTLATVNAAAQTDAFRKVTVSGKGLVTATSAVSTSDITTALGYTPVNNAGDTLTGALILAADPAVPLGAATKAYVDSHAGGQLAGFRNRIINGGMQVAQRGVVSSGIGAVTYTLDRWIVYAEGSAVSVSQGVGDGNLHQKALAVEGATSNTNVNVVQRIEAANCYDLAGKIVTVKARIYSTTPFTPTWSVSSANAVDNFTAHTVVSTGSFVLVSGWTDVSFTTTLNAACQNGVQIEFQLGATVAGVVKGITGAQLELGSVATPFEQRPYGLELALCQRYYETSYSTGVTPGTFSPGGALFMLNTAATVCQGFQFKVMKRSAPSITIYSPSGTSATVWTATTDTNLGSVIANNIGTSGCRYLNNYSVNWVAGVGSTFHYLASAEL